ncbi:hypothetical protein F0U61_44630 [Archangium violaceum]|uniref:hypothetical protein n=1 Tax=Archangium violaceum TaxID=83451 RepID=UPI002B2A1347|nr:hypothetical protein F0U61_44630 [Archangium violaceum]
MAGVLRYSYTADVPDAGNLLSSRDRARADEIKADEKAVRKKFAHLIECLRANNPVLIYTGVGMPTKKSPRPRHIIVIAGYCILDVEGEEQLWLVTADPSPKGKLVTNNVFVVPPRAEPSSVDLGLSLKRDHTLFRIISGQVVESVGVYFFASLNLIRASALFGSHPHMPAGTECDRILDHAQTPGGVYVYREKRTEAPEEVIDSSFNRPKYRFPLAGKSSSSGPWQYYHNNESLETGSGGYYLLGQQHNLHGGIHLFPPEPSKSAPVHAIAPGYIVAARLPGPETPCTDPNVLDTLGNWPGFVLVRHEVQEILPSSQGSTPGTPRRGLFYSLYMHLHSPAFPVPPKKDSKDAKEKTQSSGKPAPQAAPKPDSQSTDLLAIPEKDPYRVEVPWFRELFKRRFGAWVCLSETEGFKLGALVWSLEDFAEGKTSYKVLAEDGALKEIKPRNAQGVVQWIFKAPPLAYSKALQALAAGDVITFAEPFFPVGTGEVLGFVGPLKDPVRPAALHCQVFSPVDDEQNGIRLLTELAKQIETSSGSAPQFIEVREDSPDNCLELEEIKNHLTKALPQEDQSAFSEATHAYFVEPANERSPKHPYAEAVADFLDSKTSFAPQLDNPDWNSCERFEYPLKLEIETVHLIPPEKNTMVEGGIYELEVGFEREISSGVWTRLTCSKQGCTTCKTKPLKIDGNKLQSANAGVLEFSLMVPALAERMTLKALKGFCIEQSYSLPGADGLLFAQGITRRWRNVRFAQLNEWSIESTQKLAAKVQEVFKDKIDLNAEDMEHFAWCDSKKEVHLPRLLADGTEQSAKLFVPNGWLPPSAMLENLHPVSAVWLLNILDKQNKAHVRDEWRVPGFRQEDPSPVDFGWVKQAGTRRVGDLLTAAVIDEDFGYDKENRVQLRLTQGNYTLPLTVGREFDPGGHIVQAVQASFWGSWTLELTDTSTPPKVLEASQPLGIFEPSVSVVRPKLVKEEAEGERAIVERPRRLADGSWRWSFQFEEPVPRELLGFILLLTSDSKEGPGLPYTQAVLPVTARPYLGSEGFKVDDPLLVLEGDFIVGLTAEGKRILESATPKQKRQQLQIIKDLVSYMDCLDARDILVGWGLVQGLAKLVEKKIVFELVSIEPDGLTCTLTTKSGKKLVENTTAEKIVELEKDKSGSPRKLKITFASAICEDSKQHALWRFDERNEFIHGRKLTVKDAPLGGYAYGKYRDACRKTQLLRLHVSLASALGQVASQNRKKLPPLVRLDLDGLDCVLDVSEKGVEERVRAAAVAGGFEVEPADPTNKKHLRLIANPNTPDWLTVSFHPGRLFSQLAQSGLEPGVTRYYWFEFMALNGQGLLERFGGESTGQGDGALSLAEVEALAAKASGHIRATHEAPGEFRTVGFSQQGLDFQVEPRVGGCDLKISGCISGAQDDLIKYFARFSRRIPNSTTWEPLSKKFSRILPEKLQARGQNGVADWHVSASVPFPSAENNKKGAKDGRNDFKLELVALKPDCEPQHLEVESTFDFTPRWVDGLKAEVVEMEMEEVVEVEEEVETKGKGKRKVKRKVTQKVMTPVLKLSCRAAGVEVPVAGSKHENAWAVAREFELVIDTDESTELKKFNRKPSDLVHYAVPHPSGKRGGCDTEGNFVATLELKALDIDRPYRFSVRRPLSRPVRTTDMGATTLEYTRTE